MTLGSNELLDLYQKMLEIRFLDEKINDLIRQNLMKGFSHQYVGQEAVAVGVCAALRPDDLIASNHRGHGHCLAKGGDMRLIMAELLGRSTGYCRGRGGSMHIADLGIGDLGANGIVGAGLPIAVGSALAAKLKKTGQVTVCFFGDGASNQGTFHESLNMASAWKLPVIFACENNLYGMGTAFSRVSAIQDVAVRAAGYNIPGQVLDGNDLLAVYEAAQKAVERARAGEGPTLLEFKTYRWKGHSVNDTEPYRSKEEVQDWMKRCPVVRLAGKLAEMGVSEGELEARENAAKTSLEVALHFALESPDPDPAETFEGVYA